MKQRRVFETIFILIAFLLIILPFMVSFNEALTKLFERFTLYVWIQEMVVPVQVRIVTFLTSLVGIHAGPAQNGFWVKGTFLGMTWNCVGWQSLLLLTITLIVGLKERSYSLSSELKTVLLGLLGIFWINILRLTFIVALFNYFRPAYAYVYHDYLAAIITVIYLFLFWWFSYSFVLEEKKPAQA